MLKYEWFLIEMNKIADQIVSHKQQMPLAFLQTALVSIELEN